MATIARWLAREATRRNNKQLCNNRLFSVYGCSHSAALSSSSASGAAKLSRQERKNVTANVITSVNEEITSKSHGRLFAIVQIDSKQFKITDGDIIVVEGVKGYDIGDKIKLEKVLCVGSKNFTLFGRPLVSRDAVCIEATVIEKTMDETKVQHFHVQRKAFHSLQFIREQISLLRINRIELLRYLGDDAK